MFIIPTFVEHVYLETKKILKIKKILCVGDNIFRPEG